MIKVSVLMPVYNTPKEFIEYAIKSVINQSLKEWELIAVTSDYASTLLIEKWCKQDPRIKLIEEQKRGVSNAINTGFSCAKGEYIARLDSDDIFHPEKLSLEVKFFDFNRQVDFSLTGAWIINENGTTISSSILKPVEIKELKKNTLKLFMNYKLTHIVTPTLFARRKVYENEKFDPCLQVGEDWDFLIRIF